MAKIGKHIITASASQDGKALIRITNAIGANNDDSSSSNGLRKIVDQFLAKGTKEAIVYINSPGGSVFEANEMINELGRFESVNVKYGALAASAASLFATKFYTTAKRNTRIMLHKPMSFAEGNENEVESSLQILKSLTDDYRQAYASKMGITPEAVEDLWNKGDVWLTAQKALEMKLIDAIEGEEAPVTKADAIMIQACGFKEPVNINAMNREEIIQLLNLDPSSTDEQIMDALKELKTKADAHDAEQAASADQAAEALVNNAIAQKKILPAQKNNFLALAKSSFETTKATIEAMPVITSVHSQLGSKGTPDAKDKYKDWSLEDFLEKDPEALAKMEDEDPNRFKALNDNYYKIK